MGEAKLEEAKLDAEKEDEEGEEKFSPPPPILLSVDLHCIGCAKKIEKSILKVTGVEEVEVDMAQNQVKVRGTLEPQALCSTIQKKTLRRATVISPLAPSQGESKTEEVAAQVSEMATVELLVNMHCVACAQQLRKKILKLRGVQMAEANLSAGKITVTGTMRGESLVDYIHRCTGKIATILPQPPTEEKEVENAEEKAAEENQEKKEDSGRVKKEEQEAAREEKREGDNSKGDGNEAKQESEDQKKEEEEEEQQQQEEEEQEQGGGKDKDDNNANEINEQESMRRTMYNWNGGYSCEEEMNRRMIHGMPVYYAIQQPPPPPQIFSDENPNACCII